MTDRIPKFSRMIRFDAKGFLIPYTTISASVDEMKKHFVNRIPSTTRSDNFEKYLRYSQALKSLLNSDHLLQWINGSFVNAQVRNPRDIDLVTFLGHQQVVEFGNKLKDFGAAGSWEKFGVDAYIVEIYPEEHPKYFLSESDRKYWLNKFGESRRDRRGVKHRKGFLEINF